MHAIEEATATKERPDPPTDSAKKKSTGAQLDRPDVSDGLHLGGVLMEYKRFQAKFGFLPFVPAKVLASIGTSLTK